MSSNETIEQLVVELSKDSLDPDKNLAVAVEYEKLGQTASAVSFYLRAAEYGCNTHYLTAYAALLRVSLCIESQKNRELSVSNVLLQAIAYQPRRPEAYFLLARFHERAGNWQECYTFAKLGYEVLNRKSVPLPIDVDYPAGHYGLLFEIAISAWWVGRKNESVKLLTGLSNNPDLDDLHRAAVLNNIERLRLDETTI